MGLVERRAIKAFEDDLFPALRKEIVDAAGFDVPLEVVWDTLAEADYGPMYAHELPKIYFRPLIDALRAVAVDQLGRDALKAGLRRIVVRNTGTRPSFESGVLIVDYPFANADYGDDRTKELREMLERAL